MWKTVKKYRKINFLLLSNFVPKTIKILYLFWQKRAFREQQPTNKFFDLPRSEEEWRRVNGVNVNDPLDPGSEPYVSRASLQDDVR